MIKGFDAAVADMEVGQIVDVHLMPEEAYGMPDPNAVFTIEIAQLREQRRWKSVSRRTCPINTASPSR